MKYEDVSWHNGTDNFPKDLPAEAAATHTGMFVAWALVSGLGSRELAGAAGELQARRTTPGAFFYNQCDGKFTDEDLNDEGNAFAKAYFDPEVALYLGDYDAVLCDGLETAYHVPDTWASFEKLKPRLDRRLVEWRRGVLGKRPWWRFWA